MKNSKGTQLNKPWKSRITHQQNQLNMTKKKNEIMSSNKNNT